MTRPQVSHCLCPSLVLFHLLTSFCSSSFASIHSYSIDPIARTCFCNSFDWNTLWHHGQKRNRQRMGMVCLFSRGSRCMMTGHVILCNYWTHLQMYVHIGRQCIHLLWMNGLLMLKVPFMRTVIITINNNNKDQSREDTNLPLFASSSSSLCPYSISMFSLLPSSFLSFVSLSLFCIVEKHWG